MQNTKFEGMISWSTLCIATTESSYCTIYLITQRLQIQYNGGLDWQSLNQGTSLVEILQWIGVVVYPFKL